MAYVVSSQGGDISQVVTDVSWGGAIGTAARKLTISCQIHPEAPLPIDCGSIISLSNGGPIMSGIIVNKSKKASAKTAEFTAYDARWWLLKSTHDEIFRDMTATEIVAELCAKFGVPVGSLVDTKVKFESLQLINKSVWDMITISLTETRKVTGKKYTTKMVNGRICLAERKDRIHQWVIEEGYNLLDASYTESIEDMSTQVLAVGKSDKKQELKTTVKNAGMVRKYGVLQHRIDQAEAKTQAELNAIAAQKLSELCVLKKSGDITALGIDALEAGDGVYVVDKTTGLVGGFWVESDDHKVSNQHHTMSVKLSWTNELPSIDYEPPNSKK